MVKAGLDNELDHGVTTHERNSQSQKGNYDKMPALLYPRYLSQKCS